MTFQASGDLFAALQSDEAGAAGHHVSGLHYVRDFIDAAEEEMLIARIDACGLSPFRFQQWTGKRLTRSFGWRYDFENGTFAKTDPIPDWLGPLKSRAERFAGLQEGGIVQPLLIRYDAGAGIGWHKDRPVFEHVVGISLGRHGLLRLRRRNASNFDRQNIPLAPRSFYHLSGEVRHDWEHSLLGEDTARWSITFRSLRE